MRSARSSCHAGGSTRTGLLGFLALGAPLAAQVPAHATTLNPTTAQAAQRFLQHGDFVHAFGDNGHAVYHARSADGGRTWPLREQAVGTFWLGAIATASPAIHAVSMPGQLLVLAHDVVLGPGIARSFDDGAT